MFCAQGHELFGSPTHPTGFGVFRVRDQSYPPVSTQLTHSGQQMLSGFLGSYIDLKQFLILVRPLSRGIEFSL